MKEFIANRTLRFTIQTLEGHFESRLDARRRLNKRMFAALAAKFMIRRVVRRKGADFEERLRRLSRDKFGIAALTLRDAQCQRAGKVL